MKDFCANLPLSPKLDNETKLLIDMIADEEFILPLAMTRLTAVGRLIHYWVESGRGLHPFEAARIEISVMEPDDELRNNLTRAVRMGPHSVGSDEPAKPEDVPSEPEEDDDGFW